MTPGACEACMNECNVAHAPQHLHQEDTAKREARWAFEESLRLAVATPSPSSKRAGGIPKGGSGSGSGREASRQRRCRFPPSSLRLANLQRNSKHGCQPVVRCFRLRGQMRPDLCMYHCESNVACTYRWPEILAMGLYHVNAAYICTRLHFFLCMVFRRSWSRRSSAPSPSGDSSLPAAPRLGLPLSVPGGDKSHDGVAIASRDTGSTRDVRVSVRVRVPVASQEERKARKALTAPEEVREPSCRELPR